MTAVFVTYNSVGRTVPNGWHEFGTNKILVMQGFIRKGKSGENISEKRRTLVGLWRQVCAVADIRTVDLFAIYCGKIPDLAMSVAAGLLPKRVIFLHCGCGWIPEFHYSDLAMNDAGWIQTECGGIAEMFGLFTEFKDCGMLKLPALRFGTAHRD